MATAYRKTQMGYHMRKSREKTKKKKKKKKKKGVKSRMSRSEVVIGQVSPSFVPPFPPQAEPADAEHHNALTLVQHDRKLIPPSNPSYSSR
jgi:predicted Holliday junction resolvase-like endonuclease